MYMRLLSPFCFIFIYKELGLKMTKCNTGTKQYECVTHSFVGGIFRDIGMYAM